MPALIDSGDRGYLEKGDHVIRIKKWCLYDDDSLELEIWEKLFLRDGKNQDVDRIFDCDAGNISWLREGVRVSLQKSDDLGQHTTTSERIKCNACDIVRVNFNDVTGWDFKTL